MVYGNAAEIKVIRTHYDDLLCEIITISDQLIEQVFYPTENNI